jgi:hypothetical protein
MQGFLNRELRAQIDISVTSRSRSHPYARNITLGIFVRSDRKVCEARKQVFINHYPSQSMDTVVHSE